MASVIRQLFPGYYQCHSWPSNPVNTCLHVYGITFYAYVLCVRIKMMTMMSWRLMGVDSTVDCGLWPGKMGAEQLIILFLCLSVPLCAVPHYEMLCLGRWPWRNDSVPQCQLTPNTLGYSWELLSSPGQLFWSQTAFSAAIKCFLPAPYIPLHRRVGWISTAKAENLPTLFISRLVDPITNSHVVCSVTLYSVFDKFFSWIY